MHKPSNSLIYLIALTATTQVVPAAVLVEVDFEHLVSKIGDPDGLDDADKIQDLSGNGHHGFWGQTSSNVPVVSTPGGTGIDNSSTNGKVFLRDGLSGIPEAWDGPTTTASPYFTISGGSSYTFEAIVKFGGTDAATSGTNGLMGFVGTVEFWWRVQDGNMGFTFDDGPNRISITNHDFSDAFDGGFHHLALVYDASVSGTRTITSYLDYELVDTTVDGSGIPTGTIYDGEADFFLGAYNSVASNHFNGTQDYYRISSGVLTPSSFSPIPELDSGWVALLLGGGLCLRRRSKRAVHR